MIDPTVNQLGRRFADFLASRSGLSESAAADFALLVTRLVEAMEAGHSCLAVGASEQELLRRSALVSTSDPTPLVLQGDRLFLHRFAQYESRLAANILAKAQRRGISPVRLPDWVDGADALQRRALELALARELAIICGGPGTGKTTTVAKLLVLLAETLPGRPAMALAAPTGKAAQRLGEAITSGIADLDLTESLRAAIPCTAQTLHRLLGVRRFSPRFRHDRNNPLEWDVVVVDEASMVDLALMSKLVDALKPQARLLLLGDKDQLASVESGAVLADLIAALPENSVQLEKSYRFNGTIHRLAGAINRGDAAAVWSGLVDTGQDNVSVLNQPPIALITERYAEFMAEAVAGSPLRFDQILARFNLFQVLCVHHRGTRGVDDINRQIVSSLARLGFTCRQEGWFPGRPVLVSRNDYSLGLYNGDIGICLNEQGTGKLLVWFSGADGRPRGYPPSVLPPCETAYAITVHKSQGSEWGEVVVIFPEDDSPLLSRELVYTAVTRARLLVRLVVDQPILDSAVRRSTSRCSGLVGRLSSIQAEAM